MQDRPDAAELAEAVRRFLQDEVMPTLSPGRLAFQLRVAINAVGMLEREARIGGDVLVREAAELARHLGEPEPVAATPTAVHRLNDSLCERLRAGNEPPGTHALLRRLQRDKLAVASPGTLAKYPSQKESQT